MKTRLLTAAAVLVSAYVHLRLWTEGYKDIHMVGPAFMVNAVAGVIIAVLLVVWRSWEPPLLAAGFGAATLVAFLISTTSHGLYGVHEHWFAAYSGSIWAAFLSEIVALVGGLLIFWREGAFTPQRPARGTARRTARI